MEPVGGEVVRTRVGDIYITEAMIQHNAVFGGEPVGAWVHPDVNMCPDGVLSALRLMQALDAEGKKLSEFIADIPDYPTLRAKIECPNKRKKSSLKEISEGYKKKFGRVSKVNTIDGVRLELKDGWVLMRPSGTEPVMRITVEAENVKKAEKLMETAKAFVSDILGA